MRRAARTDLNHREVFDAAEAVGRTVIETYQLGKGAPDGFVFDPRIQAWHAVEVKRAAETAPGRKRKAGSLTRAQTKLHAKATIRRIETAAQMLVLLGATR